MWNTIFKPAGAPEAWTPLASASQLETIRDRSKERPVVLFKHSTRCGISMAALRRVNKDVQSLSEHADLFLLDLLQHRDISNQIAATFGVAHESPQVLVIQNGHAVYNASHGAIEVPAMLEFMSSDKQ